MHLSFSYLGTEVYFVSFLVCFQVENVVDPWSRSLFLPFPVQSQSGGVAVTLNRNLVPFSVVDRDSLKKYSTVNKEVVGDRLLEVEKHFLIRVTVVSRFTIFAL